MLIITFIIAVITFILVIILLTRKAHVAELEEQVNWYKEKFDEWDAIIPELRSIQDQDWEEFTNYTKVVKPLLDKNSIKYSAILTQLNELQHLVYGEESTDDNSKDTEESAQTD